MKNTKKVTRQYVLREDDQKTIILALRMYERNLADSFENITNQFGDYADYSSVHSHQFDLQGLTHLMHEKILINVTSTIDGNEPNDSEKWGDDNKDKIGVDFPEGWMDMKILEEEPIKKEIIEEEPKTTMGMKSFSIYDRTYSMDKVEDINQYDRTEFEDTRLKRFNLMEVIKRLEKLWDEHHIQIASLKKLTKECDQMRDELDKRRKEEVISE